MIDELRSRKLFGPFRGEMAAERGGLVRTLVGLSRIGIELRRSPRRTSTRSWSGRTAPSRRSTP